MPAKEISRATVKRLPIYLAYLKSLPEDGPPHISATALANALGMGEVQVRKDLALISDGGRPKIGYLREGLIQDLECFLGYTNTNDAVLVGAGKLGRALLGYGGFAEYGLNIVAAFDSDDVLIGTSKSGKPIMHMSRLDEFCRKHQICIGIITVPAEFAQEVCDQLIANGIKAIWNFAPKHLDVPEGILVQPENMATSLAVLSKSAKEISKSTVKRLPVYLSYLKGLPDSGPAHISATALAGALNMGEVQVRKDLALISDGGRPKIGYLRESLIQDIEGFLGYTSSNDAVLVGAGKLGRALLGYGGFAEYGLNIVAAFDSADVLIGTSKSGKPIMHMSRLDEFCREKKISIGIVTVPSEHAQGVCDRLIANGVKAIWNFAPKHLDVPEGILLQSENMAASLALLSQHLSEHVGMEKEQRQKDF